MQMTIYKETRSIYDPYLPVRIRSINTCQIDTDQNDTISKLISYTNFFNIEKQGTKYIQNINKK